MDNYDFGCAGQPGARARANGLVLLLEIRVMMIVALICLIGCSLRSG